MCPGVLWSKFQKIVLFFQHFITFSRELISGRPNFFWKICQNGILHTQRKFSKEKEISLKKLKLFVNFGLSAKKTGVLVEKFGQGCQNWLLRNGKTFPKKIFHQFWTMCNIFSVGFQNGLLRAQRKNLKGKEFFWRNCITFGNYGFSAEPSWIFGWVVKTVFYVRGRMFLRIC